MLTNRLAKMSDKRVKRRFWPTHIYDYNYKVSEGYYKPQTDYSFTSGLERSRYSPPKHATYAERFADSPWYGSTRGLPYANHSSALNEPLLKPSERHFSGSQLLKEMKNEEDQNIPLHIRASRRRKRFEEEDELLGIRPRLHRTTSLEDKMKAPLPPRHKDVSEKLRNLDAELIRLAPRSSSMTHESYSLPSGTSVHKSTRNQVSHYDSSFARPPVAPRARKFSYTEESTDFAPRPRQRISSVGESATYLRTSRRSSLVDDEDDFLGVPYPNRAGKLRDMRKMKQSRDITEGVYNLVEKMRSNRLNLENAYLDRTDKGLIKSRLDPHLLEDQKIKSSVTYNVKRH